MNISEKLDKTDDYKLACKQLYGRDDLIPLSKSNTSIQSLSKKQQDIVNKLLRNKNVQIGKKPK